MIENMKTDTLILNQLNKEDLMAHISQSLDCLSANSKMFKSIEVTVRKQGDKFIHTIAFTVK